MQSRSFRHALTEHDESFGWNPDNRVPAVQGPFGILLLGLAAAVIVVGAIFPDFFGGYLGPGTP